MAKHTISVESIIQGSHQIIYILMFSAQSSDIVRIDTQKKHVQYFSFMPTRLFRTD